MLEAILGWSIRHRLLVLAGALALVIAGVLSFRALPIDAFPDTTPVQVQVNTVAPTLGPLEIERQITAPVEQAIAGLRGLDEVRSLSRSGLSQVTVVFADGTDIYLARQIVSERIGTVQRRRGVVAECQGVAFAEDSPRLVHRLWIVGADARARVPQLLQQASAGCLAHVVRVRLEG